MVIRGKMSVCALICIIEVAVGVPVEMTNHEKKKNMSKPEQEII